MKVILPTEVLDEFKAHFVCNGVVLWQSDGTVVVDIKGNELPAVGIPTRCISYLDEYIVVCPILELNKHRLFWQDIVNYIVPSYSHLVELSVNRDCLSAMFSLAEHAGIDINNAVLVDFGCGNGIIQSALKEKGYRPEVVIGVESNAHQRKVAEMAGLNVVSSWEAINYPVDLIVASYSLHMGCSLELFELASLWLKPHGLMLANCYKDIGIEHINPSAYSKTLKVSTIPSFPIGRGPLFLARRCGQ